MAVRIGLDRVRRATHAQIDRSDHFPAAAVLGILGEMLLDLGDKGFDVVGRIGRGETRRERLARAGPAAPSPR